MRFRQVHLDFHTSEAIPNIGSKFSKEKFQNTLIESRVNSITLFSKCHHGWAYHPSKANEIHPNLSFDLLGAQIEAAHEIDVKTPVYISAGLDEKIARRRPDWMVRNPFDGSSVSDSFMKPGYHLLCMNSPYLEILLAQVDEVAKTIDADGLFLDIVGVKPCRCNHCVTSMLDQGLDPKDLNDVQTFAECVYRKYAHTVNETAWKSRKGLPVFHNSGHITRGRRDLAHLNSHLELESLPTGGWGYDHFPLSARYCATLGMDYLGMTGKFHTTWGEFGGYKHPNALRYEAALALANGARMSIGDQLPPSGELDVATYKLIGRAFQELETKEMWTVGAKNVADIALLSSEAALGKQNFPENKGSSAKSDAGAVRILLEGKFLFDVVDLEADFSKYRVLILPDSVRINDALDAKLQSYLSRGGKVFATGESGLSEDGTRFQLKMGSEYEGIHPFQPSFFKPRFGLASLPDASFVFYGTGHKVKLTDGENLGDREQPFFNREFNHFCSHQHAPSTGVASDPGMIESENGIYLAWQAFEDYATKGSLAVKETVTFALNRLLPEKTVQCNLPAQGVVTLTELPDENIHVLHLIYGSPVKRGDGVEVVEDLLPVYDTKLRIRLGKEVNSVKLQPQDIELVFNDFEGICSFTLPKFECHQIVVMR